jgi:hypothetical protein
LDPLGGRSRSVIASERVAQPFGKRRALLIAGVCEANHNNCATRVRLASPTS